MKLNYVIYFMIPLQTMEDSHFMKIFNNLVIIDTILKIMSRWAMSKKIFETCNCQQEKLRRKLQNIDFVCSTANI